MVTVTFGMTAPALSAMVPVSDPYRTCAWATLLTISSARNAIAVVKILIAYV